MLYLFVTSYSKPIFGITIRSLVTEKEIFLSFRLACNSYEDYVIFISTFGSKNQKTTENYIVQVVNYTGSTCVIRYFHILLHTQVRYFFI